MAKSKETVDLKGKLSRKIAELTMVVHLLFTRNHEREVEIEALKTVYGNEIKKIDEEVKGKVSWLEGQLEDFEKARVMLDLKESEILKHKQQAQLFLEREVESRRNLDEKNHLLAFAEKDIIKLREQLLSKVSYSSEQSEGLQQMRDEVERLKKANEDLSAKISSIKTQKQKNNQMQIDELQTKVKNLDRELKEALSIKARLEKQLDGHQNDWQGETDRLQMKIAELLDCQREDQDKYYKLEKKNKQFQLLSRELEESNRTLNVQIQQLLNDKNRKKESRIKGRMKQETPEVPRCTPAYEKDEELERLRREVQRYRLEISNRESNFNRVFADHKPIVTGGRRSISNSPDHAMFPNLTGSRGRMSANGQVSPSHLPSLK